MWQTILEWQTIFQLLAHVATIIGVPIVLFQLHRQINLTKIANTQSLVALSSPFNLQLIQDRKMAEFWVHGSQKYVHYDEVDKYRYDSILIWWLILHENIYYQWKSGLLDKTIYDSWQYDLRKFANCQLKARWNDLKPAFQPEFAEHVSDLLFDLQLMPWGDGSEVPASGTDLVIVGIDEQGRLHIRIFDAGGHEITDTDETKLPATQAGAISTLKQQLPGLLPPHVLTTAEKAQLISEATSIVG